MNASRSRARSLRNFDVSIWKTDYAEFSVVSNDLQQRTRPFCPGETEGKQEKIQGDQKLETRVDWSADEEKGKQDEHPQIVINRLITSLALDWAEISITRPQPVRICVKQWPRYYGTFSGVVPSISCSTSKVQIQREQSLGHGADARLISENLIGVQMRNLRSFRCSR